MKTTIKIEKDYLYIPVNAGNDLRAFHFYEESTEGKKKIMEFSIPVHEGRDEGYLYHYKAELLVRDLLGKTITIEGDYPETLGFLIENSDKKEIQLTDRPLIHHAVKRGWSNDPNGMVYHNGVYHLYYQYNPFDLDWANMSWGHATSKDLLHWEEKDPVMYPDEYGTMFSGCGLVNERGMLGLPEDALLFYYTVAGDASIWSKGKPFTQNIAYSLDGGETLIKMPEPTIDNLYFDNRDPKIFWHEETQAYVMVLWLTGYTFGILRSTDLKNWEKTQEIELDRGWECPDLFCLKDEHGEKKWFFWAADGRYYSGDFDGYTFTDDGTSKLAYISRAPYAAQTYSNVEDRTISIPWLRFDNDGRLYTSAYGIPTEMSYTKEENSFIMVQKPVREFYEQMKPVRQELCSLVDGMYLYNNEAKDSAAVIEVELNEGAEHGLYTMDINKTRVVYDAKGGYLKVGKKTYIAGRNYKKLFMIVDNNILEMFFDGGKGMGTFALTDRAPSVKIVADQIVKFEVHEVF